MSTPTQRLAVAAIALVTLGGPALAADLVIGTATEPSAMDPLFSRTGPNQNIAMQIFDRLVQPDVNLGMHPGLAESWTNLDPTTWRVKLRADARFHDGKPVTADDVVFSLERARNVPNSPAPFSNNVSGVTGLKALDATTLEVKTAEPTPDLMERIGFVYILERAAAEGKSLQDYNKGDGTIGSGPYRFKEWVPGDRVVLTRNDAYWGKKPEFDTVTIKFISNDAARVAALRSGAVDLIDGVPPADLPTLEKTQGLKVHTTASARLIYLALDGTRDESPFVTDLAGKPLTPNPLKDVRVRTAIARMINTPAIVDRVLNKAGVPAGQLVPEGVQGHDPALKPIAFDLEGAKKLLAEAGYKDGFGLTIHSSNDRFAGDKDIAQALGQMLSRGGIKVNGVVTQPYNVYAGAATKQTFSAFIFSLGNTTPTSGPGLRNLFMTNDPKAGTGGFNRTRYSNPAFDKALTEALSTFDEKQRLAGIQAATKLVFADMPIVPLYWQTVSWASKANIAYEANMSEDTSAALASVAK
ncbi:ABC transporter substrate-binding protein [Alsobacter sp. SYSU M60028]|uniref:ABC transporter substrate-binding protein n=1 Tax=Alsobacter ponti TaxID=2962936 RepID=A0ABT1LDR0_9HYPH|nr:ABC transporter substrate-binding protein [Alsobacter ponti]MCP8939640.1 ABC transporter substrate-binding protein [Alsobacter ponti]